MKKRIFVFLVLIVALSIAVALISRKKDVSKTSESGFGSIISPPKIPEIISENPPISFEDEEISESFPKKLPTINQQISIPLSDTEARKIAADLGFDSEPIIAEDAKNGLVYIWNNKTNSLIITLKLRKIKYAPSGQALIVIQNTKNKQLNENDRQSIAVNFLNENFAIDKSNLGYVNTVYLKLEAGADSFQKSSQESADIYRVNFSPILGKVPIITLNPLNYIYYLDILKDGNILNAEITIPNELSLSNNEYELKSNEEIMSSINTAEIVSINNGNENLHDLENEDLNDIQITSTKIAYLFDDVKSLNLQPIFILEGDIKMSGQKDPVEVILYMPAFKQ